MNNAIQLLDMAAERGVVKARASRGILTPELLAELRQYKGAILELLRMRQNFRVASGYVQADAGQGLGDPPLGARRAPSSITEHPRAARIAEMRRELRRWSASRGWQASPTYRPAHRITAGEPGWLAFTRSAPAEDIERAHRALLEDTAQRNDRGGRGA